MTLALRLRAEAKADLLEASGWYDTQTDGLGEEFLAKVERSLTRIEENPRVHAELYERPSGALAPLPLRALLSD